MIPCAKEEIIYEIKEKTKRIDIIEKSHIKLTVIQQEILKKQDKTDNKLTWLLGLVFTSLITIVLFLGFGIGGN